MKHLANKWKRVGLKRTLPAIYPRYYTRLDRTVSLVNGNHFLIDTDNSRSEVFFENIGKGFWMMSFEVQVRDHNHYTLNPKKKITDFFSINILHASLQVGYGSGKEINWAKEHVIFSRPGTTDEFYLQKGTILKCSRLIFSGNYLAELANINQVSTAETITGRPFYLSVFDKAMSRRTPVKAELFLQDRLFSMMRYERNSYHYRSSISSILYELTAFFFVVPWNYMPSTRLWPFQTIPC